MAPRATSKWPTALPICPGDVIATIMRPACCAAEADPPPPRCAAATARTAAEMTAPQVRRLGYALGAQLTGVDASRPLDAGAIDATRRALLEHIVLVLPAQDLGPGELTAFCEAFGEPDVYNTRPHNRHPEHPAIYVAANKGRTDSAAPTVKKSSPANQWHSDYAHCRRPSTITFLLGKDLPEVGGDTMFANLYTAYETLSPAYRAMIEPLQAVHDIRLGAGYASQTPEQQAKDIELNPPVVLPLVRAHPETGRKALFVTDRIRSFVGMTEEETRPILGFLREHAVRYEFTYRHRWTRGELVMWDNRCALHYAVQDYDRSTQFRRMLRCSLVDREARSPVYSQAKDATAVLETSGKGA